MELKMNIQIMKIYNESFLDVRSHKREWVRVAYAPLLIWALGAILLTIAFVSSGNSFEIHKAFMGGDVIQQESLSTPFLTFAHIIYSITYFIALISLYINGYRYAILHEGGRSWITLNLNMRFVKMVLYSILISILGGIYVAIVAGVIIGAHALFESIGVDVLLGILFGLYGLYLMFRIVLYPVAISIDQSEALKTSWRLMKGNVLRLIGLFLLVTLTIMLIGIIGVIVLAVITGLLVFGGPMLALMSLILWVPFGIFMVLLGWAVNSKAMALVYQELSEDKASS
jgi:hypothetical protein